MGVSSTWLVNFFVVERSYKSSPTRLLHFNVDEESVPSSEIMRVSVGDLSFHVRIVDIRLSTAIGRNGWPDGKATVLSQ